MIDQLDNSIRRGGFLERDELYRRTPGSMQPPSRVITEAERELLRYCRRFRTLDHHAEAICRLLQVESPNRQDIRAVLNRLAGEGWLMPRSELLWRLVDRTGPEQRRGRIEAIGFVTRCRPRALIRSVRSYAENARYRRNAPRFIIMDDSADGSLLGSLRDLAEEMGISIAYAGLEEKREFVKRLSLVTGASPSLLEFALLDPLGSGATYGANRNALLLETGGEMFLSADDDTVCRVASPPAQEEGLVLAAGRPPLEYWFYPDLESALAAHQEAPCDLLARFDSVLGRPVSELLIANAFRCNLDRLDDAFIERLWTGHAGVIAALPGLLGDLGGGSPVPHLLGIRGESRKRLLKSVETYRLANTSRDCLRSVAALTVSDHPYLMGTVMGLDGRRPLPPFFPIFRCEDNLYGSLLSLCFPELYISHLPTVLTHTPESPRSYDLSIKGDVSGFPSTAVMIEYCMSEARLLSEGPEDRCVELGKHLAELAAKSWTQLGSLLRNILRTEMQKQLRFLRLQREVYDEQPAFWSEDMRRMEQMLESRIQAPDLKILELNPPEALRQLLERYGKLLMHWPRITMAAKDLREQGKGLARSVHP